MCHLVFGVRKRAGAIIRIARAGRSAPVQFLHEAKRLHDCQSRWVDGASIRTSRRWHHRRNAWHGSNVVRRIAGVMSLVRRTNRVLSVQPDWNATGRRVEERLHVPKFTLFGPAADLLENATCRPQGVIALNSASAIRKALKHGRGMVSFRQDCLGRRIHFHFFRDISRMKRYFGRSRRGGRMGVLRQSSEVNLSGKSLTTLKTSPFAIATGFIWPARVKFALEIGQTRIPT